MADVLYLGPVHSRKKNCTFTLLHLQILTDGQSGCVVLSIQSIPIGIKSFGQFFIPPMKFRGGMKEFL